MGVDPILWNCVGSRSYVLKKNLDKTTEIELICYPPLLLSELSGTPIALKMTSKWLGIEPLDPDIPRGVRTEDLRTLHDTRRDWLYRKRNYG